MRVAQNKLLQEAIYVINISLKECLFGLILQWSVGLKKVISYDRTF